MQDNIKELYENLRQMLAQVGVSSPQIPKGDNVYQSPIHGSWKSSGGFSMTPTDPRHPKGHMGVDMRAPGGTAIYSMADGVVTNVGTDKMGGNVVNVSHPNNVRTYYAHLGSISVHKGDKVTKDTVLGTIGDSGNAAGTPPHCHFQVWENGQIQNPAKYFSVPAYEPLAKNESAWLPGAQVEARNWNIQQHVQNGPAKALAFNSNVDLIAKGCEAYYNLTKR